MFWQVFASLLNWLCGRNLFCWYALQGRFIRLETIELISWLVLWLKLTLRLELIFMDGKIAKFKEFHAVRLAPVALLFDGIFIYTFFFIIESNPNHWSLVERSSSECLRTTSLELFSWKRGNLVTNKCQNRTNHRLPNNIDTNHDNFSI